MTQPPAADDLLNVVGVSKIYVTGQSVLRRGTMLRALHDVSFNLRTGETLGIVGESGCGKTTLGKIIVRLLRPNTGRVLWMGRDLTAMAGEELQLVRRDLQFIFQDPQTALNPLMTVGEIIAEPLRVLRPDLKPRDRMQRTLDMMAAVNLLPDHAGRFPHEFSGGQAQRIGIARALITGPQMIVCDEPVSALDLSVQAQILNLLQDVKDKLGLTLIVISHNLNVVRHIADRVLVLYLGQVMEIASVQALRSRPLHPYTSLLLSAAPVPDPRLSQLTEQDWFDTELPSPLDMPTGCPFHTRCAYATDRCRLERPQPEIVPGHGQVSCHNWRSIEMA